MFGWIRSKPGSPGGKVVTGWIAKNAFNAALKLNALMREYPHALLDTARLPLPKPAMKLALKITWQRALSDEGRRFAEDAYLHLSHFQDGVGDAPLDASLDGDEGGKSVRETLEAWLPWAARSGKDVVRLTAELKDFTGRQARRQEWRWAALRRSA
jgi:hypothetical protein